VTGPQPQLVSGAGSAPPIVKTIVIALYDADSGRIRHTHTVLQHKGAGAVSESAAIERAHQHARQLGHDVAGLRSAVSSQLEHGSTPHRIDLESGRFVPLVQPTGS
jgi:hypothetical protein